MTPGRGCASTRPGTTSSAAGRSCCRSTPRCSSGSPTAPEDALTDAELTELHDGNAFVRDRAYVFFDWGDACVSHPFHTLVVTLRALAYRLGLEPGSPSLLRLRDAYLEPWSAHGSGVELVETADLARRTGTLQGALA